MTGPYNEQNPSVYSKMIPMLLKKALINLKKRKSFFLIDLGCGKGEILYCLKKEGYLKKARVFGLDIDPKAISAFKKKMPEAKAILADASNLEILKANSFDLVICNQVVEHVEDDKILIHQINHILKKGGLLYIASVLKKWYGLYWYRNKFGQIAVHPDHLREYSSSKEFRDLLTKGGFNVKKLNVYPSKFPIVDYFLLFLAKLSVLKSNNLRDFYFNHPRIHQLSNKMLFPPIPGYATIEALAEKK